MADETRIEYDQFGVAVAGRVSPNKNRTSRGEREMPMSPQFGPVAVQTATITNMVVDGMVGTNLATSQHLVQPIRYQSPDKCWRSDINRALAGCGDRLTWNPTALLSIACFTYPCADHTLVKEIVRQPWLSQTAECGPARLEEIPAHRLRWIEPSQVAEGLYERLDAEMRRVCRDRKQIYLLLSGGLDSRIVAGAVHELYRRGELACTPVAVTWGLEDSLDVAYGREVANYLGFDWTHVPLQPNHLLDNVEATANFLGAAVPPNYLHRVLWFQQIESEALVLAGSYGDMVGRGEFSGRTILELQRHALINAFGLLKPEFAAEGARQFNSDVESLRQRAAGQFEYVYCEREQHCFYTRGSLAQALGVIGNFCDIYQAFTDPEVYTFMWSLHPALRTDEPYARLLQRYNPLLARLPWARTNRALAGATGNSRKHLRREYHDYAAWTRGVLYSRLRELVDPVWFEQTGIFDGDSVARLDSHLRANTRPEGAMGSSVAWNYLWLAAIRRFADLAREKGKTVEPPAVSTIETDREGLFAPIKPPGKLQSFLRSHPTLRRWIKQMNVRRLRRGSCELYPPTYS